MNQHQLINVVVTVTLVEMMLAIGLGVSLKDVAQAIRNWRRLARTVAVNYLIVPLVALALVESTAAAGNAAVGILVLAAFPGASYGPPFTKFARGDLSLSVGLMVILAASSALVGPVLLHGMLQLTSVDTQLGVDVTKIMAVLGLTQLLPLAVGMLMHTNAPALATKLRRPSETISKVLNGCTITCVLFAGDHAGSPFQFVGPVTMLCLLLVSLVAGYLAGGPGYEGRKAVALTTSLRNIGVGLMIVSGHFSDASALPAVVGYAIIELTGSLMLALWWGRPGTVSSNSSSVMPPRHA